MEFVRTNGVAVNMALVVSAEVEGDTLVLHTENRVHRVHFDSADEAQRVFNDLTPKREPSPRRKPRTTR